MTQHLSPTRLHSFLCHARPIRAPLPHTNHTTRQNKSMRIFSTLPCQLGSELHMTSNLVSASINFMQSIRCSFN